MPTPSFIIAGARKAGTNTAYRGLDLHPEITMRGVDGKEVRYFTNFRERGDDWYRSLWRGAGVEGEKSPDYLSEPWCHAHLARVCPDAKIVVFLRDPVKRAYSEWLDGRRGGWLGGLYRRYDFGALLAEQPSAQCFRHSLYSAGLASLFTHFSRRRVHVEIAERFWADERAGFGRLQRFLGVTPIPIENIHEHPGDYPKAMSEDDRKRLKDRYWTDCLLVRSLLCDPISEWPTD